MLKTLLRRSFQRWTKPGLNYDTATLPWTDSPDFERILEKKIQIGEVSNEEATMLRDWVRDGYLAFPKLLEDGLLDKLLEDHERAWKERPACYLLSEEQGVTMLSDSRPREELLSRHYRILDFHDLSVAGMQVMMHPKIIRMANLILGETPYAMQSLLFEYGSEQHLHQDFPFVAPLVLSHLIGAWVACEDADPSNGGLLYYPGSHKVRKYDFGDESIAYKPAPNVEESFENHLKRECERMKLKGSILSAKKGDAFLWHSALVHGGSKVATQGATRKSFVTHYSTKRGYPAHRRASDKPPLVREVNGGVTYAWEHPDHIEGRYPLR